MFTRTMAITVARLNGALNFRRRRKGLTLNLEYKAGPPCASRYRYDDLLHVPNGDAGGAHECPIVEGTWIREQDIHTEHNQERSSGSGYKRKNLENKAGILPSEID
jgi:hypothetical protein